MSRIINPSPPAGPRTPPPPRTPAPIPARPVPPPPPRPTRFLADPLIRLAAAVVVVGVLLLAAHYFAPVILLAALPTRRWRQAALDSSVLTSLAQSPVRRGRRLRTAPAGAAVGGTPGGSPTKLPPLRPSEGWGGAAG